LVPFVVLVESHSIIASKPGLARTFLSIRHWIPCQEEQSTADDSRTPVGKSPTRTGSATWLIAEIRLGDIGFALGRVNTGV